MGKRPEDVVAETPINTRKRGLGRAMGAVVMTGLVIFGGTKVIKKVDAASQKIELFDEDGTPKPGTAVHIVKAGETAWSIAVDSSSNDNPLEPWVEAINDQSNNGVMQIGQSVIVAADQDPDTPGMQIDLNKRPSHVNSHNSASNGLNGNREG